MTIVLTTIAIPKENDNRTHYDCDSKRKMAIVLTTITIPKENDI